jgi:hypothetical protein
VWTSYSPLIFRASNIPYNQCAMEI